MSGGAAQKLLERMKNTKSGWGQKDFDLLFRGHDFEFREGKKHRIYWHPQFPELMISVPRHDSLKEWVARDAIKILSKLEELLLKE